MGKNNLSRLQITLLGLVQGVGFRPFVFNLAQRLALSGFIQNDTNGVFLEVEGAIGELNKFLELLTTEKPVQAMIHSMEISHLNHCGYRNFEIRQSQVKGELKALVLPDLATCPTCVQEIFDPKNRRFLYPFTNCTQCGPRYSIIEDLPYDRLNTTMKIFSMCDQCRAEYEDPKNRRFHAEANACAQCGPELFYAKGDGIILAKGHEALLQGVQALKAGAVVALKGLGGFQLLADAQDERAVNLLRRRKRRMGKPFALLFPTLNMIRSYCHVSPQEAEILISAQAPILLLARKLGKNADMLAPAVAPQNPFLGAMLPYTPLHHLLCREFSYPLVATSGNLSNEPICLDNDEAYRTLGGIADFFIAHNRPIKRVVDDSVARVIAGRLMLLRRARGYAPLPIKIKGELAPSLAVGGHLKNTVAIARQNDIFVSQHIGDLETEKSYRAFLNTIHDFQKLFRVQPQLGAGDSHPDYLSARYLETLELKKFSIQHHHAHIASCMAENELQGKVLGVAWDGAGLGPDGRSFWGGEFLICDGPAFQRIGHFSPFFLPGGEAALREPRKIALGMLYEIFGVDLFQRQELLPVQNFTAQELALLGKMFGNNINLVATSSAGRIFDAVSAIIGLNQIMEFEGQAAMLLEFQITDNGLENRSVKNGEWSLYPFLIDKGKILWQEMILNIIRDKAEGLANARIARKFHDTMIQIILQMAQLNQEAYQDQRVVLSGGCFQNRYLLEGVIARLTENGFQPYWHQRVPANDGGLCLGQLLIANQLSDIEKTMMERG